MMSDTWEFYGILSGQGPLIRSQVDGTGTASEAGRLKGPWVSADITNMLLRCLGDRRADPKDEFIGRVWTKVPGEFDGELKEAGIAAISREIFLGRTDTAVHGIADNRNHSFTGRSRSGSRPAADA